MSEHTNNTNYQVKYGNLFKKEFPNYHIDQQEAILDFVEAFLEFGLSDFSQYQGKLAPSWKGLEPDDPHYQFTKSNNLWHYHIGIPSYQQSPHGDYQTSDYILHFSIKDNQMTIFLIDTTAHYRSDGGFWLPRAEYLQ